MRSAFTVFRRALLLGICLCAPAAPAFAQEVPAEVDQAMAGIRPHALRAHMGFLADDLLEGRDTATRGYDLAARYVESAFESFGLEPAGTAGSYLQPVPMLRVRVVESECSMSITRNGRKSRLQYGKDFISDYVAEQDSSVTAPVVFAGFGVTAPELEYDDYAGIDARGKIVAFLTGVPKSFPEPHKTWYRSRRLQIQNALDHGAVGILVIPSSELQKMLSMETLLRMTRTPALVWADEAGRPGVRRPEMRAGAFLSGRGIKKLFAGAPRSLEEIYKTAEEGRPQGFDLPVQASLRTVSRSERTGSANVAAVLRGSDPKLRDEYVVVTAHLDHVGVNEPVKGDAIYNGAYDNAAGMASLLEMAKAFARLPTPPRRSVLFVAFTAEEKGLYGSDYFVRHPTVPLERIVANLNLDMYLMLFPLKDVVAFGAEYSSIGPILEKATGRLGIKLTPDPLPEENVFMRSDQFSFVQKGVPSVYLMSGIETSDPAIKGLDVLKRWLGEVYHQPNDDMKQTMDFEAGAQFTRINFLLTWMMAQEDEAPRWTPGNFFADKFGGKTGTKP
jgi:hypothetical protein